MHVHTVFSTDESLYLRWQAHLLAYSHRKVNQPGPLTWLYSGSSTPPPFDGQLFQAKPYSPHPPNDDIYPPYNRIGALMEWLELSPPAEETLLIIDPDCIFITPFDEPAERGRPVAQPVFYLHPAESNNSKLMKRHGYRPNSVDPVGVPVLIHRDDLRALLPLWMQRTEEIRNDQISREVIGWIAEMWGYVFAAADLGLRHELRDLARWQTEDRTDVPLIHYCYGSQSTQEQWEWSKRSYKPWERVPQPPQDLPQSSVLLISLLNEFAEKQEHEILQE
jgi:peptidyl serine alpha-galactosyltransferase